MSERIQVGDLVQVVRVCCPKFLADGAPTYVVDRVYRDDTQCTCLHCENPVPTGMYATYGTHEYGAPFAWLRRIPPPSELGLTDEPQEVEHV